MAQSNLKKVTLEDLKSSKYGRRASFLPDGAIVKLVLDNGLIDLREQTFKRTDGELQPYPVVLCTVNNVLRDNVALSTFCSKTVSAKNEKGSSEFLTLQGLCGEDSPYDEIYTELEKVKEKDFIVSVQNYRYDSAQSGASVERIAKIRVIGLKK